MRIIQFLNQPRDQHNISAYSAQVLDAVMAKAGINALTITSTTRSPEEQARVMYENLEKHGATHQKRLYGASGDKIIDFYTKAKAQGKNSTVIIALMCANIRSAGPEKISRHSGDPRKINVIDIAPASINLLKRSAFELAISQEPRISKFLTPPSDPAYHLEIPQPEVGQ